MFCVHTYLHVPHRFCCVCAALQAAAQNGWENWFTKCEYAADFLFFSSPQSWFLWQGLSESTAKIVSWKLEFWKTNRSLITNRLLTLKRSFYLANTIQSTTTEPEKPHSAPRGLPIQHNLSRNIYPPLCRKLQWDLVDKLRMHGGGIARWGTVSHTTKCQKGNIM